MRASIDYDVLNSRLDINCYDETHTPISIDSIINGSKILPIYDIVGVRFTQTSFVIIVKLVQLVSLTNSTKYTIGDFQSVHDESNDKDVILDN